MSFLFLFDYVPRFEFYFCGTYSCMLHIVYCPPSCSNHSDIIFVTSRNYIYLLSQNLLTVFLYFIFNIPKLTVFIRTCPAIWWKINSYWLSKFYFNVYQCLVPINPSLECKIFFCLGCPLFWSMETHPLRPFAVVSVPSFCLTSMSLWHSCELFRGILLNFLLGKDWGT